jgi:predicted RNA binding protein YcfA (HicA-like mRNA interferase family)
MKFGEVRRRLQSEGFEIISQNGSHEQWKKPGLPGRVTIAGKNSDTVGHKTMKSIARQARWPKE